jgi:hypothetical protein
MAAQARGALVLSIDLELDVEQGSAERQRVLDAVSRKLLAALERHQLPATFAVADPVHSAATESITASALRHEVAVLADATWTGNGAGRQRLSRELDRRFGNAQRAGLPISSLVLRHADLNEHLDLLPKNGVTALRTEPAPQSRGGSLQPPALRYGVWQLPVSFRVPGDVSWWRGGDAGQARRLLHRAATAKDRLHFAIDGAQIDEDATALATLDRVFTVASSLRQREMLTVHTMQQAAQELSPPRETTGLQSILRPAA